jgi:hypothetical protein
MVCAPFFFGYSVFMYFIVFISIVFGLGFLCVASEYILLNHQKRYSILCCVVVRFNFGSIGFCSLCFSLELLFKH